jgi:hypothetical protein
MQEMYTMYQKQLIISNYYSPFSLSLSLSHTHTHTHTHTHITYLIQSNPVWECCNFVRTGIYILLSPLASTETIVIQTRMIYCFISLWYSLYNDSEAIWPLPPKFSLFLKNPTTFSLKSQKNSHWTDKNPCPFGIWSLYPLSHSAPK